MDTQRPWLIVGSIPDADFPLFFGSYTVSDDTLVFPDTKPLPIARGTATLLATVATVCHHLGVEAPKAALVGDTGEGSGSKRLYKALVSNSIPKSPLGGITFHYCFPDVDWHNRILLSLGEKKPILVADAGFMYAAKMSGYAYCYDLFTPDMGELAFLADPKAPHPFYTRGFLLAKSDQAQELIQRAYEHKNAASWLIVKGSTDYIVHDGTIVGTVNTPNIPAMEAIGGTGDLVTGVASAFLAAGYGLEQSCTKAAMICRKAGEKANPTPATQIGTILQALKKVL